MTNTKQPTPQPKPNKQPKQLSSEGDGAPLQVAVTHLRDLPYASDDITKATSMVRKSCVCDIG